MTAEHKILAIHQPNYIPWLGYFHKLLTCDVFVYLDAVQLPRGRSFAARNRIKTPQGTTYLTIPIEKARGGEGKQTYAEARFADEEWRAKHLRTVRMNYSKAAYFDDVFPLYENAASGGDNLAAVNIRIIDAIAGYLGIQTKCVRLSDLLDDFGQKTDLVIDCCRAAGANVYLSGTGGGRDYNDEQQMNANGVTLRYSSFEHPEYPQLWGDFEPDLSVLDALFNCGRDTIELLR